MIINKKNYLRIIWTIALTLVVCILPIHTPKAAVNKAHYSYCKSAGSTAALTNCLKRHHDTAKNRLNTLYTKIIQTLKDTKRSEFKTSQKQWLSYRDTQCNWEKMHASDVSQQKNAQLSCLARVSADRADLLHHILNDTLPKNKDRTGEILPRWFNVLAKDHGNISWDLTSLREEDFNCDGQADIFLKGSTHAPILPQTDSKETDIETLNTPKDTAFTLKSVIAVIHNPPTGRPGVTLLPLQANKHQCTQNIVLSAADIPPPAEKNEENICHKRLKIQTDNCPDLFITSQGKSYTLTLDDDTLTPTE